jgi:hypothetical protein
MINHVKLQIYEVALYKLNALFRIFILVSSLVVRGVRTGREDHQEGGQARRVTSSVYAFE